MTVKSAASRVGNAILDAGAAMHNGSIDRQITEIDEQMDALQKQLTRLEEQRAKLESQRIK